MNIKITLSLFAMTALFACSEGGSNESAEGNTPTACECVDHIKNQDEAMATKCAELRKDAAFEEAFVKCQAAAITGGDPDKVNIVKNEAINLEMPNDGTYQVNTTSSKVAWTGSKITGSKHTGDVGLTSGMVAFEGGQLKSAKITIDMTSIRNTDLEADEDKQKLVGHLMSDDFFGVESNPEAYFVIKDASMAESAGKIDGELTLKGITKPVTASIVSSKNGGAKAIISGTIMFDRTEFDVRYGSGKFFDNLGDNMINDNIVIRFKLNGDIM